MLYCQPMENEMATWLNEKLNEKDWSMRELARRIGKSHTAIADIAKGEMNPSPEMCRLIAKEFNVPPQQVFRRAGLLPPETEETSRAKEALHLFNRLPLDDQRDIIDYMRVKLERRPERAGTMAEREG